MTKQIKRASLVSLGGEKSLIGWATTGTLQAESPKQLQSEHEERKHQEESWHRQPHQVSRNSGASDFHRTLHNFKLEN